MCDQEDSKSIGFCYELAEISKDYSTGTLSTTYLHTGSSK